MCFRSPKPPPPPEIPKPRPPAPVPEETAGSPILGKKRSSQQTTVKPATKTKKNADGTTVTSRTGTAAVISRRRLGTSSLRIPLLTDLNTPV